MNRVVLGDGRELLASPGHPLADGSRLDELEPGMLLDGAQVTGIERVRYQGTTYDILPKGSTGIYWANGIPVRSTLKDEKGCEEIFYSEQNPFR